MTRAAQIVNWGFMAIGLVISFVGFRATPSLAHIIFLAPLSAALIVFHRESKRWIVAVALLLNFLSAGFWAYTIGASSVGCVVDGTVRPGCARLMMIVAVFSFPNLFNLVMLLRKWRGYGTVTGG
jgi:hypothetical protein